MLPPDVVRVTGVCFVYHAQRSLFWQPHLKIEFCELKRHSYMKIVVYQEVPCRAT